MFFIYYNNNKEDISEDRLKLYITLKINKYIYIILIK